MVGAARPVRCGPLAAVSMPFALKLLDFVAILCLPALCDAWA